MTQVVCVGDVMVDVLARLPGPLAIGSDTPAPIVLLGGGSAANVAAWLVVAGVPTTFVGCVGDDELGRHAVAELAAAGVQPAVAVAPGRATGMCIVLVDADGERTMVPAAGANGALTEAMLPARLFAPGTHLHLSGYSLLDDGSRAAARAVLGRAAGAGCGVSVDASSAAPLRAVGPERFLSWLPPGTLLLANLAEAVVLSGQAEATGAALALGARCGEAVVKRGPAGAVWSDGRAVLAVEAGAVELVDTTGAGDAFAAGLLAARLGGADVTASLRAGATLAARAIAEVGARPGR